MIRPIKLLAAGALLAGMAAVAGAAPNVGPVPNGVSAGPILVHGDHRSCERDRFGWHRHNRYGERRECREWRGQGRRPDSCVRVGPVWICDY